MLHNIQCIPVEELLQAKEFKQFINDAKDYCIFIESFACTDPVVFLTKARLYLTSLYRFGCSLPEIKYRDTKQDVTDISLSDNDNRNIIQFVGERIPFSYYWSILDPFEFSKNPGTCCGDLTDDLCDIYKDIKEVVTLFDMPDDNAKEESIWQLEFGFTNHWGEHCADAIKIIHEYLYTRT